MHWPVGWTALYALALLAAVGSAHASWSSKYAAVDAHALAAPASTTSSVQSLAEYLSRPATNDRERARAAFCWIAHNIVYDSSLYGMQTGADTVLAQRRAVCVGYAALFEALAAAMGVEAKTLYGHGKGRGYQAGAPLGEAQDHAWNAVEIDGEWHLVDCTWGAGSVNEYGQFVRSYRAHYFLTLPEQFIYDHFPSDPRWQLLEQPISELEYASRVRVKPPFFECGLRLVTHDAARIRAASHLEVTIGAPPGTIVSPSLFQGVQELDERYTFAHREGDVFVVHAVFPKDGNYTLRVFSGPKSAAGELEWALDYAVEASGGMGNRGGFPKTYGAFLMHDCHLARPLARLLSAGSSVEFSLTAPGAESVMVMNAGVRRELPAGSERFAGSMPVARGDVLVFARFPGSSRYQALLKYHAR